MSNELRKRAEEAARELAMKRSDFFLKTPVSEWLERGADLPLDTDALLDFLEQEARTFAGGFSTPGQLIFSQLADEAAAAREDRG